MRIDADTYFAYSKVPGAASGYFYIMLSGQKCSSKSAPKGWKRAAYNYRSGWGNDPACWITEGNNNVRVCPVGQYTTTMENNGVSTTVSPCHLWPKSKFIDTSTLPRQADFK